MRIIGMNPFKKSRVSPTAWPRLDQILPQSSEMAVIGGGIAGLCTALCLARRGIKVTLLEKGRLGAEQTSRAFGWVASMGDLGLRLNLSRRSKEIWASELGEAGFQPVGLTYLCKSDAEMEALAAWQTETGEDAHRLSRGQLSGLTAGHDLRGVVGGWHQASDGLVVPRQLAPALAQMARAAGVVILEESAVRHIATSAGHVSHLICEQGEMRVQAVVVAGGIWSRSLLADLGITIPQLPIYSALYRLASWEGGPKGCAAAGLYAWAANADGSYTFGDGSGIASLTPDSFRFAKAFLPAMLKDHRQLGIDIDRDFWRGIARLLQNPVQRGRIYESFRSLDPTADPATGRRILHQLQQDFADFPARHFSEAWAGVIDATPDKAPILGQCSVQGLYVNTGMSAHGLAMAPAAAELLADHITGRQSFTQIAPYSAARFGY